MIGTLHIVLAMKPTQGNFAENALKHGVAGLAIGACRMKGGISVGGTISGKSALGQGSGWNVHSNRTTQIDRTMSQGRFPSNVILSHAEGCVLKGMKKVKPAGGAQCGSKIRTRQHDFYSQGKSKEFEQELLQLYDENGNETVEDWECVEGCPVKELDDQSGLLKSGDGNFRRKRHETNAMAGTLGEPRGIEEVSYGDSGGASRFFYTVKEFEHEEKDDSL